MLLSFKKRGASAKVQEIIAALVPKVQSYIEGGILSPPLNPEDLESPGEIPDDGGWIGAPGVVDEDWMGSKGGRGWIRAVKAMRNMRDAAKKQLQDPLEAENAAPAATSNLFVVSNRLPLSVKQTEKGFEFNMSSGGLVSAMFGASSRRNRDKDIGILYLLVILTSISCIFKLGILCYHMLSREIGPVFRSYHENNASPLAPHTR